MSASPLDTHHPPGGMQSRRCHCTGTNFAPAQWCPRHSPDGGAISPSLECTGRTCANLCLHGELWHLLYFLHCPPSSYATGRATSSAHVLAFLAAVPAIGAICQPGCQNGIDKLSFPTVKLTRCCSLLPAVSWKQIHFFCNACTVHRQVH